MVNSLLKVVLSSQGFFFSFLNIIHPRNLHCNLSHLSLSLFLSSLNALFLPLSPETCAPLYLQVLISSLINALAAVTLYGRSIPLSCPSNLFLFVGKIVESLSFQSFLSFFLYICVHSSQVLFILPAILSPLPPSRLLYSPVCISCLCLCCYCEGM